MDWYHDTVCCPGSANIPLLGVTEGMEVPSAGAMYGSMLLIILLSVVEAAVSSAMLEETCPVRDDSTSLVIELDARELAPRDVAMLTTDAELGVGVTGRIFGLLIKEACVESCVLGSVPSADTRMPARL